MTDLEIRTHDDVSAFLRPIAVAFGREPTTDEEKLVVERAIFEPDRCHSAFEDGKVVGSAGAFSFELTVPGGRVPAAGVTVVGVLPTHRRRGILTRLMREQLEDVHRRGEPVAYLWATEERIYGRFGYGLASLQLDLKIDTSTMTFRSDSTVDARARIVGEDEAYELIPPIYDRVRAESPGMFSRHEGWWRKRRLFDNPQRWTKTSGALFRVVLELDGRPEAYALYRIAFDFEEFTAAMELNEALGTSPEATREIWRYLANVDLIGTIKVEGLPVDHPLLLMVDQPRALSVRASDALWCRLVDVGAALSARSYRDGEPVVLEVRDAFCPWNEGRWRVSAGGTERVEDEAGLRLDVRELGSVYLGGFTFAQLARAGQVEEAQPGAVAAADAFFATDRAPFCPEIF